MTDKIDLDGLSLFAKALSAQQQRLTSGEWLSGPAAEFHQKFLNTTAEHFQRLKYGGTWRGVTWKYFSPGSFGRKRPSGQVINPGIKAWDEASPWGLGRNRPKWVKNPPDSILQDTGRLIREAGKLPVRMGAMSLGIVTNLSYASLHNEGGFWDGHRIPARPFQFFTEDDVRDLREFTQEWLNS